MPKQVDHDQRRRELVTAAMDLLGNGGRSAVTVRALAAATGRSTGSIRHYVPSTAALERLLLDHVSARVQERVGRRIAHARRHHLSPVETSARQLEEVLPLDERRRSEYEVWLAFFVDTTAGPSELGWVWEGQLMFHRQIVLQLDGAPTVPDLPGTLPAPLERAARTLHAYTDGLALRIGSGTTDPTLGRADLRAMLTDLQQVIERARIG